MAKRNCWEVKRCGREPGGAKAKELGVCPASTAERVNGMNDGVNGGRVCWVIAGTLCGGKVQGSFAMKMTNCLGCDFYREVAKDEGLGACKASDVLKALR